MAQIFASDLEAVHVGDRAVVETGVAGKTLSGTVGNGNINTLTDTTASGNSRVYRVRQQ